VILTIRGILRVFSQGVNQMAREMALYHDRIVRDPKVMFGKPVVKGTRIPVELVLEELAYNPDLSELFGAHPALTIEDVQACLAYAQQLVKLRRPRREAELTSAHPPG
jgi:uncharacterized protein (DUF433 family)